MSSVQTMKTWEVLIKSYEEIPTNFKEIFNEFSEGIETFPYIVYFPADKMLATRDNEKILIITDKVLSVYEKKGDILLTEKYLLNTISRVAYFCELLNSWFEITGINSEAEFKTIRLEFNSVTIRLISSAINLLRFRNPSINYSRDIAELEKLEYIHELNFKFYSYSRNSIMAENKVIASIFQKSIFSKERKLFNSRISPCHVAIITNLELILVSEKLYKRKHNDNHSIKYTYIPLTKISGVYLEKEEQVCSCNFLLLDGHTEKLYYSLDNEENINEFIRYFDKWIHN